jgi:hypothetical protein
VKRKILNTSFLKQTALAVPAAALMLGASQGAQIGINFQDNYAGNAYAPLTAPSAFGIPLADWYNAPSVPNSSGTAIATSGSFAVPSGGTLDLAWSCKNTWSIYAPVPTEGDDQVVYGYLDDTDYGYAVTLTGFRNFAGDFTITAIASSDSATAFANAFVVSDGDTNELQYLNNYAIPYAPSGGLAGTSTVSSVIVTLAGHNTVRITGGPKIVSGSDTIRSTLAGILIDYVPGGNNPPLIETNPQAPTNALYPGGSFSLSVKASGTPVLGYQWRRDGVGINGATDATYTKNGIAVGDTGSYDVVVTNAYSPGATSAVAVVTVLNVVAPVITQYPLSQSFYVGYPATFTVAATGGQLSYQWKSNNVAIPGATNATYSISSVATNSGATYTVAVSNPVGPTATASATLTVKVATAAYEAAIAQTKPLLWFRYSDTTAQLQDTAANSGSLGAPGTGLYIGTQTHPVAGALIGSSDTAASFAGGRVSVPYTASLNPDIFTVEAWLKPAVANSGTTLTCPLSSVHIADPRAGWLIYQSATGWNLRTYNQNSTTVAVNITGGPAPVAGQWYHVVASWDGTVGRVYVNGALSATSDPTNYVANTDGAFAVGARSDAAFVWSGTADEVAHYSTALSDAQVLAHYQNGTNASPPTPYNTLITTDGAVEYLRLDEPAFGGSLVNAGTLGAAWNGTYADAGGVLGSPQIGVGEPGPLPPSYPGFESTNQCVTVTNGYSTAPQLPLAVNTLTVTCWINRQAVSTTGDLSWPAWLGGGGMHLNNGTATTPAAELRYHWNGNNWGWGSGLFVPADVWTFCAMVIEPTKATFYMSSGSNLLTSVDNSAHAPMDVTSPPGFGGNQAGRADRNFIGQLDETTVYNRALTQSEINTLFMNGTGAPLLLQLNPGGIIEDSKPVGTLHPGVNTELSCAWLASSTDTAPTPVTRTGVEQFAAANASQIVIPADPDFDSASGTICFWMLANAPLPGPGTEGAMIFDRRTSSGAVIVLNDAGNIFIQCAGGANSFSAGYLPDGQWHQVAVTYDQSASGSVAIYVDGVSLGSQANSAAWSWPTTQQIELGRSHDSYWMYYDGLMDDFRIYSRVLTDTEIASVYASGALVDTAALKVQYNFTTAGIGETVSWPFGTLLSSPVLGPSANWTPVSGAAPPNYPFMPTGPALFFRAIP